MQKSIKIGLFFLTILIANILSGCGVYSGKITGPSDESGQPAVSPVPVDPNTAIPSSGNSGTTSTTTIPSHLNNTNEPTTTTLPTLATTTTTTTLLQTNGDTTTIPTSTTSTTLPVTTTTIPASVTTTTLPVTTTTIPASVTSTTVPMTTTTTLPVLQLIQKVETNNFIYYLYSNGQIDRKERGAPSSMSESDIFNMENDKDMTAQAMVKMHDSLCVTFNYTREYRCFGNGFLKYLKKEYFRSDEFKKYKDYGDREEDRG